MSHMQNRKRAASHISMSTLLHQTLMATSAQETSKRQSPLPTIVLLRTTLVRTIKLRYYVLRPGSNHLL